MGGAAYALTDADLASGQALGKEISTLRDVGFGLFSAVEDQESALDDYVISRVPLRSPGTARG